MKNIGNLEKKLPKNFADSNLFCTFAEHLRNNRVFTFKTTTEL